MGVAIVTDSTASLTPELVADAGVPIRVVPLHVVVAGHEFTAVSYTHLTLPTSDLV